MLLLYLPDFITPSLRSSVTEIIETRLRFGKETKTRALWLCLFRNDCVVPAGMQGYIEMNV